MKLNAPRSPCVGVGYVQTRLDQKAVAIAVRNVSGRRRWSKLSDWLRPGTPLSRRIGVAS